MVSYRTLSKRISLYNEVLRLRQEGLSPRQIVDRIHRLKGGRLDMTYIYRWTHGVHTPLGNVNKFSASPSPTLAYIIGVKAGDGYVNQDGSRLYFGLCVVDYEFAAETGRCLAKLLELEEPSQPLWDRWNCRWRLRCGSLLLCHFLEQPLDKLIPYIEHCRDCAAAFLRGFSDSEGGISGENSQFTIATKNYWFTSNNCSDGTLESKLQVRIRPETQGVSCTTHEMAKRTGPRKTTITCTSIFVACADFIAS